MAFDFKKEFKEFYMPKNKPEIVTVPKANYIAVRGKGNPNEEGGEYRQAIGVLYAIAYTLKMSYKSDYKIEGFFEYVVPPLEGFWWQDGVEGCDYTSKAEFHWISVIRLPDFVTRKDFDWAVKTASEKKKMDCTKAEFFVYDEGLCVQIMHHGAFDDEPATVAIMDQFLEENGYRNDFSAGRLHHEIYMSDARKVAPEKWKTVIRHVKVELATNGKDALEKMKQKKYDLIFLDHMMPGMNGVETMKKAREMSDYKDAPIIALTGNASVTARDEYLCMGFTDYLEKPIQPDKMKEILRTYIG